MLWTIGLFYGKERECVLLGGMFITTVMAALSDEADLESQFDRGKRTAAHPVSPFFEEVHHCFEVADTVLSFHVHQDAV